MLNWDQAMPPPFPTAIRFRRVRLASEKRIGHCHAKNVVRALMANGNGRRWEQASSTGLANWLHNPARRLPLRRQPRNALARRWHARSFDPRQLERFEEALVKAGNGAADVSQPAGCDNRNPTVCTSRFLRDNWLGAICAAVTSAAFLMGAYRNVRAVAGYAFALLARCILHRLCDCLSPESLAAGSRSSGRRGGEPACSCLLHPFVPLSVRFSQLWPIHNAVTRVVFTAAMLFFTLGTGLACIYLVVFRYKLTDLGVKLPLLVHLALVIHVLFAAITLAFCTAEIALARHVFVPRCVWGLVARGGRINGGNSRRRNSLRMLLMTRLGAGPFAEEWACLSPHFCGQSPCTCLFSGRAPPSGHSGGR